MVELKLTFNTLNELNEFLNANADKPLSSVAAPSKKTAPPKKKAAPAKKKAAAAVVDITPDVTAPATVADVAGLRAAIQTDLIAKNDAFNDGSVKIMAFVQSFGVAKFSELPDDQLVDFGQKLEVLA